MSMLIQIRKSPSLYAKFPEIRSTTPLHYRQATWIIYGIKALRCKKATISASNDHNTPIIAAWQVGQYDVFLMGGKLTPAVKNTYQSQGFDVAALDNLPSLKSPGIALFDMDSTAIQIECIDEIAKLAGVGKKVAAITERAMQGELDFEQSLRERVAALKGTPISCLAQIRNQIPYMSGMKSLANTLQHYGWKVAIASGGFTWFSDKVKQDLHLDFAQSNQLVIENDKLTGELSGELIDAQKKSDILYSLSVDFDIPIQNTIAVGDGANDLRMMQSAGLGIAYHAKHKVQNEANVAIKFADLTGVMCILSASLKNQ